MNCSKSMARRVVPAGIAAYDRGVLAFSDATLVQLPEVDLSMPFNVVTLQSTIVALYVGTVAAALYCLPFVLHVC